MRSTHIAVKAVVALTILGGVGAFAPPACATPYSELVVFGDSNVDNGNLYAATGLPASPPYYQGRFSTGPVVVEYTAQRLGIPLVDYAYGGATTGTNVPLGSFSIPSVLTQVNSYSATLNGALIDPNALVVVWAGSNDLLGAARNTPAAQADLNTRISNAVANIGTAVGKLVQEGARTILVANRTPRAVLTSDDNLNGIDLNAAIKPAVQALAATLDTAYNANIALFDDYDLIADIQTNPGEYGFTNTTQPCLVGTVVCATPDTYTQWDGAHKTTRVHSILADDLIAQVQNVPEPGTLVLLVTGVAVFALRHRASAATACSPTGA